ncbi:MAG: hypothetical protein JXB36_14280 [Gammaproteobacteria bacterium]|nr:hypothetical protein [Gammaproteobacteria bacterium]
MADRAAATEAGAGTPEDGSQAPGGLARRAAALAAAALLIGGCASGPWLGGAADESPEQRDFSNGAAVDMQGLNLYLEMMRDLVQGDPVTQAITFRDVAQSAGNAPTTTNRLKLALAYATPGHPAADPAEAQRRLGELLAAGAALLPEERMLVAIHLEEVEQRLMLDAQAEQLRQEAESARVEQNNENSRRLEAALAENERLREQLEEAQQKLNAITNIERSIRERENGADTE